MLYLPPAASPQLALIIESENSLLPAPYLLLDPILNSVYVLTNVKNYTEIM
jgi:hypothetical protein